MTNEYDETTPEQEAKMKVAGAMAGNVISFFNGVDAATAMCAMVMAMGFMLTVTSDDPHASLDVIYDELVEAIDTFNERT